MIKVFQRVFKGKLIVLALIMIALPSCPLTVNLNIATEKPLADNLVVDKPVELKVGADVAVSKLAPVKVGLSKK